MELRDIVSIFVKRQKTFWSVLAVCLVLGAAWWRLQPVSYVADLAINVSRSGVQQTADYRYEGFYRLQADERFADTVVEWLAQPRIVNDVYAASGTVPLSSGLVSFGGPLDAKRLSSQLISIRYRATDPGAAERLATELVDRINRETEKLNASARESDWFLVIGDAPVVRDGRVEFGSVMAVMALVGVFLGFWAVLFHEYFLAGRPKGRTKE